MQIWLSNFLNSADHDEDTRIWERNIIVMVMLLFILGILCFLIVLFLQDPTWQSLLYITLPTLSDLVIILLLKRKLISIEASAGFVLTSLTLGILSGMYVIKDYTIVPFFLAMPIMLAGLILPARRLWIVLVAALLGLWLALALFPKGSITLNSITEFIIPQTLFLIAITLMTFLGTRTASDARANARQQQTRAESIITELELANTGLEQRVSEQTASLQESHQAVQKREAALIQTVEELRASHSSIQKLSAPVVPILPGVIIAPIIGTLSHERAELLQKNVLETLKVIRVQTVILDITGVPVVDTHVAQIMTKTARAIHIMGAKTLLVGIRPEVAQVLVSLDVSFENMRVFANLQQAVAVLKQQASTRERLIQFDNQI